jgi:hypothetical protein
MPNNLNNNNDANPAPLLYCSLSTRGCSYPIYILLRCSRMPNLIKRQFLVNQICSALITSGRAVAVPPLVDDIADALIWLLDDAPFPL